MNNPQIQTIKQRYGIAGNCDALNRALEVALKIAPVDLSVLVTGENGVGKENFPRIIHDHSLRKTKKFFAVNCGAIPEGTIDSELFGHEKGAFTGAIERREGYFSVANGGRGDDGTNRPALLAAMMKEGYGVTKLATTGGFLRAGNTTLLTGVEDVEVPSVSELMPPYNVQVYTLSGQMIMRQSNVMAPDLSTLGSGLYIVQYEKDGKRLARKVIR